MAHIWSFLAGKGKLPCLALCTLSTVFMKTVLCEQPVKEELAEQGLPKIAIIGAGIGGSSAAYFSRQLLGKAAQIDVFESSAKAGGRLRTIEIGGKEYEAGGSIIHKKNAYMVNFVKDLGLHEKKSHEEGGKVGIWNGDEFIFMTSKSKVWTMAKLMWRYGLLSPYRMNRWVSKQINTFTNIYKLQEQGKAFTTVPDMLRAMGGDEYYGLTKRTLRAALEEEGVSEALIDELITGITKVNYGQNPSMAAFAGSVSLAGSQPGLWAVYGGNYQVCESLLKSADVNLHLSTKVTSIVKLHSQSGSNDTMYKITTDGDTTNIEYDLVIIATPLELESTNFTCSGCTNWPEQKSLGDFQRTVAKFVRGDVNIETMGLKDKSEVPEMVLLWKILRFFNSVGLQNQLIQTKLVTLIKVKKDWKNDEDSVWKVFSRSPLSQEQLDQLFVNYTETGEVDWLAYPHYTVPYNLPSFVLDDGVFYVNAIEWSASCMEVSAIGGKNVALLGNKYLNNKYGQGDSLSSEHSKETQEHQEL